jgi:hypothetical protein
MRLCETKELLFSSMRKLTKLTSALLTDRFHIGSILLTETWSFVRLKKEVACRFGNTGLVAFP